MKRKLLPLCAALLLFACTGKEYEEPVLLISDKAFVLQAVNVNAEKACEYRGRAVFRFQDLYQKGTVKAIVDKSCGGELHLRLLGPLGMTLAEIFVEDGSYRIVQGGKDVTENPPVLILESDLQLLNMYFKLPPPLPDKSYDMALLKDRYLFTKGTEGIAVTPDFRVTLVYTPDHAVEYIWNRDILQKMSFFRDGTALDVEFTDRWIRE